MFLLHLYDLKKKNLGLLITDKLYEKKHFYWCVQEYKATSDLIQ